MKVKKTELSKDILKAHKELQDAKDVLKKAHFNYYNACRIISGNPVVEDEVQNSELMQLAELDSPRAYLFKSIADYKLIEKFYEIFSTIEFLDESGEPNKLFFDDLNYKKCEYFLKQHIFTMNQIGTFFNLISDDIQKNFASNQAQLNAIKRLENDPKQKALDEIFDHYESRKSQFKRRGYTAEFVREMHAHYPVIIDIKTIQKLVASLNKDNELIPR